jgi:serine O-acetyltransferase
MNSSLAPHLPAMTPPNTAGQGLVLAIDQVVESYAGPEEINNLKSAALPNRRAVIDAYNHLVPALFMGFYATRPLDSSNLRHTISEHLYPAYEALVEQTARAISYESFHVQTPEESPRRCAEQIVLRLFEALPALRRCLNVDVLAAFEGDPAAESIEEVVFSYPGIRALTAHRVAHLLHSAGVPMLPRIIAEYAHGQTGIDIHSGAVIGEGLFIDHGTGVVIGETAVIGKNVKIYQNVTLGALSVKRTQGQVTPRPAKRHPTIEDDVTIYSGAKILGGETVIGKGSVIGGNVWLVASVPPHSRIFGGKPGVEPDR